VTPLTPQWGDEVTERKKQCEHIIKPEIEAKVPPWGDLGGQNNKSFAHNEQFLLYLFDGDEK
jgi:hypothetical protein